MSKPHSDWTWTKASRRLRVWAEAEDAPCWICGKPIDYTAPQSSRWSFTADHLDPIGKGGDLDPGMDGLRPAHRRCNSRRGKDNREVERNSRRW
jgi:hypothetical protein